MKDLCIPLLKSLPFYLICIMSVGLTFIRETFREWSPIYLKEALQVGSSEAVIISTIHPIFGGVSTLVSSITTFSTLYFMF